MPGVFLGHSVVYVAAGFSVCLRCTTTIWRSNNEFFGKIFFNSWHQRRRLCL